MATRESEAFVRTFARGLKVIEALSIEATGQNLAQLASSTKLPRAAIRRFLLTLIDLEMVRSDGKQYWLTPRVLRLGLSYLSALPYWREAQFALEELCASMNQSCALSVLDGTEIVYLQRQHASRILPMSPTLGSRMPAFCVSMGRALLSDLPDQDLAAFLEQEEIKPLTRKTITDKVALAAEIRKVRSQGYAWGDGEFDDSIAGIAMPVRDMSGRVIAAINISLPAGQYSEAEAAAEFLPALQHTAARIRASTGS